MSPATTSRPKRAAAAAKVTTKQSQPAKKTTNKRSHKAVTGARKRAKDESDQEDEPEDGEESDQDDEDNYGDEEEQSDDSDDDDAFEDDSTVRRAISRSRSKKAAATKSKPAPSPNSSKSSKSSTKTSQSSPKKIKSNGTVVPTQEWVVSKLKIPRPKGGPVADAVQPETLEFIRDLKENNDREYMFLNQERFLAAKADFMDFIRMVKEGLLEADPDVMDQEPKDSMMRI